MQNTFKIIGTVEQSQAYITVKRDLPELLSLARDEGFIFVTLSYVSNFFNLNNNEQRYEILRRIQAEGDIKIVHVTPASGGSGTEYLVCSSSIWGLVADGFEFPFAMVLL